MVNKRKSKFIYLALEDTECFAVTRRYMEKVVFPKNQEIESEIKSSSYAFYKRVIERPLEDFRLKKLDELRQRKTDRFINIEMVHQEMLPSLDKSSIYYGAPTKGLGLGCSNQLNLNEI